MARASRGTPAVQALTNAGVEHTVHAYELSGDEDMTYGEAVAAAVGVAPSRLFKTLVVLADGDPVVAVVPVDGTLDTKALARVVGAKRVAMAPGDVAERLTGYLVGGISPFGQKRRLPMIVHDTATGQETVFVSAGRRGLQIEVPPDAFSSVAGARYAEIARYP